MLKDFWRDFIGAVDEIKDLRVTEVLDVLDDMLGPHIYPAAHGWRRRAPVPDLRHRQAQPQGRQVRRLCRLLELSGMPLHPSARRRQPRPAPTACSARTPRPAATSTVKAGRFGPYIQLGEQKDYGEDEKPKRAGIPKGTSPGDIELDRALKLLSLPREIGKHPESGLPITAGLGRFGPFVKHDKTYASWRPATKYSTSASIAP